MLSREDLPAPEGPMMAVSSPEQNLPDTPFSTILDPEQNIQQSTNSIMVTIMKWVRNKYDYRGFKGISAVGSVMGFSFQALPSELSWKLHKMSNSERYGDSESRDIWAEHYL